jgi:hypothetical protein
MWTPKCDLLMLSDPGNVLQDSSLLRRMDYMPAFANSGGALLFQEGWDAWWLSCPKAPHAASFALICK